MNRYFLRYLLVLYSGELFSTSLDLEPAHLVPDRKKQQIIAIDHLWLVEGFNCIASDFFRDWVVFIGVIEKCCKFIVTIFQWVFIVSYDFYGKIHISSLFSHVTHPDASMTSTTSTSPAAPPRDHPVQAPAPERCSWRWSQSCPAVCEPALQARPGKNRIIQKKCVFEIVNI